MTELQDALASFRRARENYQDLTDTSADLLEAIAWTLLSQQLEPSICRCLHDQESHHRGYKVCFECDCTGFTR